MFAIGQSIATGMYVVAAVEICVVGQQQLYAVHLHERVESRRGSDTFCFTIGLLMILVRPSLVPTAVQIDLLWNMFLRGNLSTGAPGSPSMFLFGRHVPSFGWLRAINSCTCLSLISVAKSERVQSI